MFSRDIYLKDEYFEKNDLKNKAVVFLSEAYNKEQRFLYCGAAYNDFCMYKSRFVE